MLDAQPEANAPARPPAIQPLPVAHQPQGATKQHGALDGSRPPGTNFDRYMHCPIVDVALN